MTNVKALLVQLENNEQIDHDLIARLKNEGYVTAKVLKDNDGTVAFATHTGLTEKGKQVLNNED